MAFPPEPLVQILNNFTKLFLIIPFTEQGVGRAIDKKYLQMIFPEQLVQNQNNFTEMFLMFAFTKVAQMGLLRRKKG